jgi:hypothetical protein
MRTRSVRRRSWSARAPVQVLVLVQVLRRDDVVAFC